jgi:hypothetical protein
MTTRGDRIQAAIRAKNRARMRIKHQYHTDPLGLGNPRVNDPKVVGKMEKRAREMCR